MDAFNGGTAEQCVPAQGLLHEDDLMEGYLLAIARKTATMVIAVAVT